MNKEMGQKLTEKGAIRAKFDEIKPFQSKDTLFEAQLEEKTEEELT